LPAPNVPPEGNVEPGLSVEHIAGPGSLSPEKLAHLNIEIGFVWLCSGWLAKRDYSS
jgi:hypothetical protein